MKPCATCGARIDWGFHDCFDVVAQAHDIDGQDVNRLKRHVQRIVGPLREAEKELNRYRDMMCALREVRPDIAAVLDQVLEGLK